MTEATDQVARDGVAAAAARQDAHEQTCSIRYRHIATNLDQIWKAIEAQRGGWTTFLLWLIGGMGVALVSAIGIIGTLLARGMG